MNDIFASLLLITPTSLQNHQICADFANWKVIFRTNVMNFNFCHIVKYVKWQNLLLLTFNLENNQHSILGFPPFDGFFSERFQLIIEVHSNAHVRRACNRSDIVSVSSSECLVSKSLNVMELLVQAIPTHHG
jgi:hypothetical protein